MDQNQDQGNNQRSKLIEMAVKLALSAAVLFPLYALLYITFPASVVALYVISAGILAVMAPWDQWRKKFLS